MVLEHIFPEDWLEKKAYFAFILGFIYSLVGILLAKVVFKGFPAMPALAFTAILLLPELYKIFSIEERKERMETHLTLRALWKDDIDIIKIYFFMFLGVMLVYSLATLYIPGVEEGATFKEQLSLRIPSSFKGVGSTGVQAVGTQGGVEIFSSSQSNMCSSGFFNNYDMGTFYAILTSNFIVMLACFILALLTGDGAIFFIIWNASVWGSIFGFLGKTGGQFTGISPYPVFGLVIFIVFAHMIIEAISYFLAAISGSVISKDVLLEEFASDRFMEVFSFNLYLFGFALLFLLLGAVVETLVLTTNMPIISFALIAIPVFLILLLIKYFLLPEGAKENHLMNNFFLYLYAFTFAIIIMNVMGCPTFGMSDVTYKTIIDWSCKVVPCR